MSSFLRRSRPGFVALAWVVIVAVVAATDSRSSTPGSASPKALGEVLIATTCGGTGTFSVCSPDGNGPVLYPGLVAPSNLPLSFGDPLNADIYIDTLTVNFLNAFGTCDPTAFALNGTHVTVPGTPGSHPSVTVNLSPAVQVPAGHTATYNASLVLTDNGHPQNGCAGVQLQTTFVASAHYTDSTVAILTAVPSPSSVGSAITLTDKVSAGDPAADTSASNVPTGTVAFYQCTSSVPASCTTLLGTAALTSGSASLITSPLVTAGTAYFQAVFSPTPSAQPNFAGVSSTVLAQAVQGANCLNIPTTGAGVTTITGTYNGNYEVKSGTLSLNGGTISGNVTVDSGASFTTSGGKVGGNIQSTAGSVALQGTTVGGNVQSTNGSLGLGPNTSVGGNVQPTGGTVFCSSGASSGPVTVGNQLQVLNMSSNTTPVQICNTTVKGNLQYQSNAIPVIIGGSSSCTAVTVSGNFQVQSNSAKVTIGGSGYGNSVGGNLQVQSNSGGGTLTGNAAGGNCQLQSDKPGIVGTGNTAGKGNNSCNTGTGGA